MEMTKAGDASSEAQCDSWGRIGLERVADRIWTCSSSGQCVGKGPTNPFGGPSAPLGFCAPHERFKFEDYTCRGRLYLARLLYQGKIDHSAKDLVKVAYTDTACGICDKLCTLRPLEAFRALREELMERGAVIPEGVKKINEDIRAKHNTFGAISERRSKWAEGLSLPKKGTTLYFAGCYASYRQPETAKATVNILRKAMGKDIAYLGNDEWCCGLPALWNGDRRLGEKVMDHNFEMIKNSGAETVVFSCAEGYRTFKIDYKAKFGKLPFRVIHISELLSQLVAEKKIKFNKLEGKLTYHDPCFLGRHSNVYDEPREVIKSIPGVELVEMKHNRQWAFCCGSGAGVVQASYPEFTGWTANKRIMEAKEAADTVITACPRCVENLKNTARGKGIHITVYDLPVFVAKAMQ